MAISQSHYSTDLSYKAIVIIAALVYACILTVQPVDAFVDRDNYLFYTHASKAIMMQYAEQGVLNLLLNEPLWLSINIIFEKFVSPETSLKVVIFFSSLITAYVVLRHKAKYFLLLLFFLFLPQVLKNNIIHLRQGLAIAIFLVGWFSHRKDVRYSMFLAACLIHSSFFIVNFLVFANHILQRFRFSIDIRSLTFILAGVLTGFFGLALASALGARQGSEYIGITSGVSGLGFIFWSIVAAIFTLEGKRFLNEQSMGYIFILFYLSTYFFLPVTARVFESTMLITLISAFQLTSYRQILFFGVFCFYFAYQWLTRLPLPGFGWGIENYL